MQSVDCTVSHACDEFPVLDLGPISFPVAEPEGKTAVCLYVSVFGCASAFERLKVVGTEKPSLNGTTLDDPSTSPPSVSHANPTIFLLTIRRCSYAFLARLTLVSAPASHSAQTRDRAVRFDSKVRASHGQTQSNLQM